MGIAAQIKTNVGLPARTDITKTLEDIINCMDEGIAYDPSRKGRGQGRKAIIELDSTDAKSIADCMESGCSIQLTTELLNMKKRKDNEESDSQEQLQQYRISAVYGCVRR